MQAKPKQVTESVKIDNPQQLLHILEAARGNFDRRHIWLCEGALICLSLTNTSGQNAAAAVTKSKLLFWNIT